MLKTVLKSGEAAVNEFHAPNGGIYQVVNQRVDDDGGEPIGLSVIAIDVTVHRASEKAVREHESHFRKSLHLSPSIIWAADMYGALTYISPAAEDHMLSNEERISSWMNRLHPDDVERVRSQWLAWLPSGALFKTEFRLAGPGGEWRWVESRATATSDERGEMTWNGVINDISDLTKLRALVSATTLTEAA